MHPELFTLPGGFSVKTYGFFMMVGFLSGVWMAMRRASRVKADPDIVLDISLVCLIAGIAGARIFYVVHYWKTQFADTPNPLFAVIDITGGGLEFLGGFLCAVIATVLHAFWKKYSLRMYLDIMAPSAMWGAGIGRIGCFFNGCCYGAIAATAVPNAAAVPGQSPALQATHAWQATVPWAVQFPYWSPAQQRHWEDGLVAVPAELVSTSKDLLQPFLVPESQIFMSVEKRQGLLRSLQDAEEAYKAVKDKESLEAKKLKHDWEAARKKVGGELGPLLEAQRFPSRVNPQRQTSVSELERLAGECKSLPVHPAQLYATIGAVLLSMLLALVFHRRKRHGMVIGLVLLLYPIQRTLEEMIRSDNPQDVVGLTVSQSVSIVLFLVGVVYLLILYKTMPERSPLAVSPPPESSTA